jgi:hypothetical protein
MAAARFSDHPQVVTHPPRPSTPISELTQQRLAELETAVLGQVGGTDERLQDLMRYLIRHLHSFVREARPTEDEWLTGLDFLVKVGHACNDQRNEYILLSDMLGLTSAVDEVNFPGIPGVTPSSVEGPFHTPAPARALGAWVSLADSRQQTADSRQQTDWVSVMKARKTQALSGSTKVLRLRHAHRPV